MYRYHVLKPGEILPDLPSYGGPPLDYNLPPIYGRVISQGMSNGLIRLRHEKLPEGHKPDDVRTGALRAYAYALIRYFDAFGRKRELQFGYTYWPEERRWELMTEREYNRHA
jgi:hypothetical protein